jgi:hypothetical protein
VILVNVPADRFFSGVIEVTPETELKATFSARREGEMPFVQIEAVSGQKLPAKFVEIVLYSHSALAENNEAETDSDWEIISINARATVDDEPLTPMAMARNFLEFTGGTKAEYSAEEFAKSIVYWSNKAMKG